MGNIYFLLELAIDNLHYKSTMSWIYLSLNHHYRAFDVEYLLHIFRSGEDTHM